MATMKKLYVFATCFLSGFAALFSVISLATEQWVVTESARWVDETLTKPNAIKYGLFQGTFAQQQPTSMTFQITMTCLVTDNVCAMLCAHNQEARFTLLKQLYNNTPNIEQDSANCPAVQNTFAVYNKPISPFNLNTAKKYINCGVWISTILFLILSIIFGAVASALAIYNTVSNPVEIYFSIYGLYIYNGIALGCVLMSITLWGVMFITIMYYDVGVFYTLTGQINSDKRASLGYSYWLNIIPITFYFGSICVLYARHYLLSKDPGHKIVQREDNADPGIYLY